MNKHIIVAVIITAIIAGGSGYYEGKSAQTTTSQIGGSSGDRGSGNAGGEHGGRNNNGGFVSGQILSKDATSITVELRSNRSGQTQSGQSGSKIIFLSNGTQVMKSAQGSTTDLTVGQDVMINGTSNIDGSVTAQTVQIRPRMPDVQKPPQQQQ